MHDVTLPVEFLLFFLHTKYHTHTVIYASGASNVVFLARICFFLVIYFIIKGKCICCGVCGENIDKIENFSLLAEAVTLQTMYCTYYYPNV